MMLLLDIGNSRIKWALVQEGSQVSLGAIDNAASVSLQQAFARLPVPSRILVSNVAGEDAAKRVRELGVAWGRSVDFVSAKPEQCGVRNAYAQPQRLGSDRWAALIAAWHEVRGACLVVNCGTATTVDALSAQGEFLGGLILPGLDMMQRSLAAGTAQLEETEGSLSDFPLNTADAIHSGVIRATLGAIESQFLLLRCKEAGARCVLSGGASTKVMPHLSMPFDHVDNLVLRGLQIIGESEV
ncbi:MAG: type III pantothenate kinase [Gallionellaceae bacterium]|nr:MAG: type III pantothenate kinase [Gallionellaceae bacterium]